MQGGKGKTILLRVITAICLAGIIFVSFSVFKEIKKKKEVQDEITKLQEEAEKINKENLNLQEKIAYLESRDYKEKEAKDKLNLQNPGENLIIIKPNLAKEEVSSEKQKASFPQEAADETPNYKKWWNYFFKY